MAKKKKAAKNKKKAKKKVAKKTTPKVDPVLIKPLGGKEEPVPVVLGITLHEHAETFPALMAQKILRVANKHPIIECTGYDEKGGFWYTEASNVNLEYSKTLREVGLSIVQTGIQPLKVANSVYQVICTYSITDTSTGYSITSQAAAIGDNGVWSLNSAQTKAKKQLFLDIFYASCPQPKDPSPFVRPKPTEPPKQTVTDEFNTAMDQIESSKLEEKEEDFTGMTG